MLFREDNGTAMTESGSEHFGVQSHQFQCHGWVFRQLWECGWFDSCPYLFEPEYTDEELLQFDEWTTRLQKEIWSHTAQNKWNVREMPRMQLSEPYTINLSWSVVKTSTFSGLTLAVHVCPQESRSSLFLGCRPILDQPPEQLCPSVRHTHTNTDTHTQENRAQVEKYQSCPLRKLSPVVSSSSGQPPVWENYQYQEQSL